LGYLCTIDKPQESQTTYSFVELKIGKSLMADLKLPVYAKKLKLSSRILTLMKLKDFSYIQMFLFLLSTLETNIKL
jgi:hypothetical protein